MSSDDPPTPSQSSTSGNAVTLSGNPPPPPPSSGETAVFGGLIWVVGFAIVWAFTWGREFLGESKWRPILFAVVLGLVLGSPFALQAGRGWVKANARRQGLVLTFGVVPLLF